MVEYHNDVNYGTTSSSSKLNNSVSKLTRTAPNYFVTLIDAVYVRYVAIILDIYFVNAIVGVLIVALSKKYFVCIITRCST